MMTSVTVQEFSCWQTDTQTDATENNTTLDAQVVKYTVKLLGLARNKDYV